MRIEQITVLMSKCGSAKLVRAGWLVTVLSSGAAAVEVSLPVLDFGVAVAGGVSSSDLII